MALETLSAPPLMWLGSMAFMTFTGNIQAQKTDLTCHTSGCSLKSGVTVL